jgi:hypothetical protein
VFYWFRDDGKCYELRGYGPRWNEKHICKGRRVELCKGYSKTRDKIHGEIGRIVIGSPSKIFSMINFRKIIPVAETKRAALKMAREIIESKRKYDKYIAFQVIR